jgi:hypothetical protein
MVLYRWYYIDVLCSEALIKRGTHNISGFYQGLPSLKKTKENQNIYSYYIIFY